ncbi:DUF1707 SHOCT-like domain-containing protein [Streptomyces tsukubensis]|uniref:Uncharacterized protein n=1 Tax=Streptomyces tsukubensis TaxID=83656 RepID=A0A1V4ABV1_9ACTN|nr:DUF1707 domain-containing protein [Streptomyces tsukubensis]OON81358.1 hypothetical protein B1H18_08455 [Streptomyces tsukubensis]QFR95520.1 DUF1707 domain-containing protein [Streptomyces tsukubensis]
MDLEKRPQQTSDAARPVAPSAESNLRASDAERDRTASILREALAEGRLTAEEHSERIDGVYRAKTVGELEPFVSDLPVPGGEEWHPRPAPAPQSVSGVPGVPAEAEENLVAVFSSSSRKGRWRVARRTNAYAIFGSVEIDLGEALFEHQHVVIKAYSIFGSVEIRVPENVTLHGSGGGVLGNFEVESMESGQPQAPVVHVEGYAVLGSIEAKPRKGSLVRDLHDRLRKHLGH